MFEDYSEELTIDWDAEMKAMSRPYPAFRNRCGIGREKFAFKWMTDALAVDAATARRMFPEFTGALRTVADWANLNEYIRRLPVTSSKIEDEFACVTRGDDFDEPV